MENLNLPQDLIPAGSILSTFRGSISHNTYKPSPNSIDDVDLASVYIAPVDFYIGLDQSQDYKRGNHVYHGKFDLVSYELRQFINLALRFNPNIIVLLWLKDRHYLHMSPEAEVFITNRNYFSSKRAYTAFTGYASEQLKKMLKEGKFQGYMGDKRKALVKKFGYDCINASHAIRLLKMGFEFLETGQLNVYRDNDRNLLIDVKNGEWGLDRVQEYARHLLSRSEDAVKRSKLPEEPDRERVNKLFMEVISDYVYDEYHMPMALNRY